jgi:thiol-disulfide isomerase/thioredoxin
MSSSIPTRSASWSPALAAALLLGFALTLLPGAARAESCSLEETTGTCGLAPVEASAKELPPPPPVPAVAGADKGKPVTLQMFYAHDCPHCHEAMQWLPQLEKVYPNLKIEKYEVKANPSNRQLFEETAARHHTAVQGVPTFFLGDETYVGFYRDQTCSSLADKVRELSGLNQQQCEKGKEIKVPLIGSIRADRISLMQLTLVLGVLDSFNPCAMWVLTFLLSILVYSRSRQRTMMIGGIFVAASGLVYFAFMAAWLNLFVIIGMHKAITFALAAVAIFMGLINMKELFFFKKGVSLMIPDSAKPKIADRVRGILHQQSTIIAVGSTIVLAAFANFVELGCTVGFPAIYTKVLAERQVSSLVRYSYMALYNVIYVIPLAIIVIGFGLTMGHFRMTEKQAKPLKLISGVVMLALGLIMLLKPELLVLG